ncbi:hypothetical protein AVEN_108707-1 [Araneus ventricosus]|uniref:Uncharacterized protein n=1 Tax=Araneus ventricosus TaxID=182803 RepID=A0A4Y2R798_ARAVE|nr:hypothetical protein AVEN_108707-1 [Araneus ventricosus]
MLTARVTNLRTQLPSGPISLALIIRRAARVQIWHLSSVNIAKSMFLEPQRNCVRKFVIPAVNFGAADCVDLIDLQACNVTPPGVLIHINSHEVLKMTQDDVPMDGWDFIKFPSHTQTVERIVILVTEASRKKELDRRTEMDLLELH